MTRALLGSWLHVSSSTCAVISRISVCLRSRARDRYREARNRVRREYPLVRPRRPGGVDGNIFIPTGLGSAHEVEERPGYRKTTENRHSSRRLLGRPHQQQPRLRHRLRDVEPLRVVVAGQPAHGDVLGVGEQQLLEAGRRLEREVDVLRAVVLGLRVERARLGLAFALGVGVGLGT